MPNRKKVLIVDDEADTRRLIRKVLKRLVNVEFFEAENGQTAIEIAVAEQPNIILMDILMPGIDGYETCRQIKSHPLMKNTLVIFLTALSMNAISDKIIQVGGDDLLRKPVDASELYFRIKNYLTLTASVNDVIMSDSQIFQNHHCDEEGNINLGEGFFYQTHSKCLCREDHFIPLMKQEILLLEGLIFFKNKVLTYEQLLNIIADGGASTVGNLRTLVKLLRKKTYKSLIRTLPSIGYQLVL